MRKGWGGGLEEAVEGGGIRLNYPAPNLPHSWSKLCHKTTYFGHAILSKQLCLHSFCLFEGMHNIRKIYADILVSDKTMIAWM